jgi:hypothetical protein
MVLPRLFTLLAALEAVEVLSISVAPLLVALAAVALAAAVEMLAIVVRRELPSRVPRVAIANTILARVAALVAVAAPGLKVETQVVAQMEVAVKVRFPQWCPQKLLPTACWLDKFLDQMFILPEAAEDLATLPPEPEDLEAAAMVL